MTHKIAIIGTGYVGLVSGACLAEVGNECICADRDEDKIAGLAQARMPIYEQDLEPMVRRNMEAGRLRFTSDLHEAAAFADFILIAVGTPALDSGDVDMSQVRAVAEQLAAVLHEGDEKIIVIKSTVPVGTANRLEQFVRERAKPGVTVHVVSVPEFLREGTAIYDTFNMDRIVIGAADDAAAERTKRLHEPFRAPVLITDRESAELIKYAANSFLATKISFINEMANVCEKVGADVTLVAKGMGMDRRIGPAFLNAGIGYGGFCLPKDTRAQLKIAENVDYDFQIMRSVINVNARQRELFVDKIAEAVGGSLEGRTLAVMGLTFKPNTDDLRDAPSLDIIRMLLERGASVRAYDPVAADKAKRILPPEVLLYAEPYEALNGADAMVLVTEWNEIRQLDLDRVRPLLASPVIVDGRNAYEPERMRQAGYAYYSIGRHPIEAPSDFKAQA